jgi:hypothetical protein
MFVLLVSSARREEEGHFVAASPSREMNSGPLFRPAPVIFNSCPALGQEDILLGSSLFFKMLSLPTDASCYEDLV